jgi:hypothetical protein
MSATSPQPQTPSEEIAGLVERVTFFNEDSGFAVLRVKIRGQRDLVTVLGSLPSISAGEWLTAKGCWLRDSEHGLQFKANTLNAVPPTMTETVELARSANHSTDEKCTQKKRQSGRKVTPDRPDDIDFGLEPTS